MRAAVVIALWLALSCANDERAPSSQDDAGGTAARAATGGNGSAGVASGEAGAAGGAGTNTAGASGTAAVNAGRGGAGGAMVSGDAGSGGVDLDASMPEPDAEQPAPDGGTTWAARALSPGPSYMGSGDGGCNTEYGSTGHAPDDLASGKHPLFLDFVGTSFSDADESSQYTSPAAAAVTEAMARRGFVALSVDYDNSLSIDLNKASCLYGPDNAQSMLAVACALPEVDCALDCALGIATWGHSQGALIAHSAARFDERVRAVWTTGYGGSDQPLPSNRLRVVNGENDPTNAPVATLNTVAGFSASECPDDGRSECLRDDGSGWILVRESACELNSADHCWFDKTSCLANAVTLEPAWVDRDSTAAFALEANADWVMATVSRP
jgi:hypothetical protein